MRIYVGGLPYSTNSDELRDLFAQVGAVTTASVVEDRYSGQSRGFGFVEMENADEANAAINKFNGYAMGGRIGCGVAVRRGVGGGYGGGGGGRY